MAEVMASDKEIKERVRKKIIYYRKKNNMTQKELANRLGLSHTSVSFWERGRNLPEIPLLIRMTEIFGITLDELCGCISDFFYCSPSEKELIEKYRSLNKEGKQRIDERVDELEYLGYIEKKDIQKQA